MGLLGQLKKTPSNILKTLQALSNLPFQITKEIDPENVLKKPITIVGDNPRVDLLTALPHVTFNQAWTKKKTTRIDEVRVPYISLEDLIASKDTDRLQDQADRESLFKLKKK